MRPPQFLNLTTSKTKQFCKTSFKNGKLSAELTASYQCVLRFFHPTCLKIAPATKKWCQVIRSAAPVTQNHLSKPEDLMLQKSAPGTPSSSDEHVSWYWACHGKCIFADPLQMSHACHRFWKCYKTLTFCSLLPRCTVPCACEATSGRQKVVRTCDDLTFWLGNVLRATTAALFWHLNFQKWSKHVVVLTFWLRNVLRATTACTSRHHNF